MATTNTAATATQKRFIVMSIPDNQDGAFWFVYDRQTGRSIEFPTPEAADAAATQRNQ